MPFIKWTDIEGLHNIVKSVKYRQDRLSIAPPVVRYRGKIKLHGTNAGIRIEAGEVKAQSRGRDITPEDDNMGFAAWVDERKGMFEALACDETVVIFGEFCGRGIMKGVSIAQIDRKVFCIFAVQVGDDLITDPEAIYGYLAGATDEDVDWIDGSNDIYILPWAGDEIVADYGDRTKLVAFQDAVNEIVLQVEACDPWVKAVFGIEGTGEGLVYYPVVDDASPPREDITNLMFKAKGKKHRVKASKKAVQIDPDVLASITEFVDAFVTEARCEQALTEACGGEFDVRKTGLFIKWMGQDVKKESKAELIASGLNWKQVSKAVGTRAREWYVAKATAL
jgi:hypothetical protein